MKRSLPAFTLLISLIFAAGCGRDYKKGIIGKWDAGHASETSRIQVEFDPNGVVTATITNSDIKPAQGTYTIIDDKLIITLAKTEIPYTIKRIRGGTAVLATKNGKITWRRVE